MADNNNALILVGLVGAYLYMKNRQVAAVTTPLPGYNGQVASMPGNVGTGHSQVKTGALVGFLQAIAGGFGNNSSTGYVQPNLPPINTGALQDDAAAVWDSLGSLGGDGGGLSNYVF
jgi:hypothetical protein